MIAERKGPAGGGTKVCKRPAANGDGILIVQTPPRHVGKRGQKTVIALSLGTEDWLLDVLLQRSLERGRG